MLEYVINACPRLVMNNKKSNKKRKDRHPIPNQGVPLPTKSAAEKKEK
jgi:hypothetical protein